MCHSTVPSTSFHPSSSQTRPSCYVHVVWSKYYNCYPKIKWMRIFNTVSLAGSELCHSHLWLLLASRCNSSQFRHRNSWILKLLKICARTSHAHHLPCSLLSIAFTTYVLYWSRLDRLCPWARQEMTLRALWFTCAQHNGAFIHHNSAFGTIYCAHTECTYMHR